MRYIIVQSHEMGVIDQSFYFNYISLRLNFDREARRLRFLESKEIAGIAPWNIGLFGLSYLAVTLLTVGLMQYKILWTWCNCKEGGVSGATCSGTKVGCINEVITLRFISLCRAEFKYQRQETDLRRERKIFFREIVLKWSSKLTINFLTFHFCDCSKKLSLQNFSSKVLRDMSQH